MQISIADVLTAAEIAAARKLLDKAKFESGRRTAGWAAGAVKDNMQAVGDLAVEELRDRLVARINANALFKMAVRPKDVIGVLFSRYGTGQSYGSHVDNAIMQGQRTDVSFTLFLSDPESYEGGELVIETPGGEDAIKLDAGGIFAYPSTSLHRVAPVTKGDRLVMVGWVRSFIRDAGQRELLFDLETAQRAIFERQGKTAEFDLVSKSLTNLLRMWVTD